MSSNPQLDKMVDENHEQYMKNLELIDATQDNLFKIAESMKAEPEKWAKRMLSRPEDRSRIRETVSTLYTVLEFVRKVVV